MSKRTKQYLKEEGMPELLVRLQQAQKQGKRRFPQLSRDEFDSLRYRAMFDGEGVWTERLEHELVAQFKAHYEQDKKEHNVLAHHSSETSVWKLCAKMMGCFPTDIVGIAHHLEYQDGQKDRAIRYWSGTFCSALEGIMVHPIFEVDPAKVALTIQYAVIHRTQDSRKWDMPGVRDDRFLGHLQAKVKSSAQDGTKSIKSLRKETLAEYVEAWPRVKKQPPTWANLFRAIEQEIRVEGKLKSSSRSVWKLPYQCITNDINRIKTALGKTLGTGNLVDLPIEMHKRVWKDISQVDDFPLVSDLQILSEEYALHKLRQVAIAKICGQGGHTYKHYASGRPTHDDHASSDSAEESESESTDDDTRNPFGAPAPPVVEKRGRGRPKGSGRATKSTPAEAPKSGERNRGREGRATSPVAHRSGGDKPDHGEKVEGRPVVESSPERPPKLSRIVSAASLRRRRSQIDQENEVGMASSSKRRRLPHAASDRSNHQAQQESQVQMRPLRDASEHTPPDGLLDATKGSVSDQGKDDVGMFEAGSPDTVQALVTGDSPLLAQQFSPIREEATTNLDNTRLKVEESPMQSDSQLYNDNAM